MPAAAQEKPYVCVQAVVGLVAPECRAANAATSLKLYHVALSLSHSDGKIGNAERDI